MIMKIKFEHQGKIHLLAHDTSSVDMIKRGILSRYPNKFKKGMIIGFVKNNAVHQIVQWKQVEDEWKKDSSKAVKIQVFEQIFQQNGNESQLRKSISSQPQQLCLKNSDSKIMRKSSISPQQLQQNQQKESEVKSCLKQTNIEIIEMKIKKSSNIDLEEQAQQIKIQSSQNTQQQSAWANQLSQKFNYKGQIDTLIQFIKQIGLNKQTPEELIADIMTNIK